MKPWAPLGAAALALAGIAAATTAPSPAALVLRQSDVPPEYAADPASGARSNAEEAEAMQIPRATVERWGRIDGYWVLFARPPAIKDRRSGFSAITSSASVFRTAAGAHAAYAAIVSRCRRERYAVSAVARVGEEGALCARTVTTPGAPATTIYAVIWRRRRVMASTGTASLQPATKPEQTVALAVEQDGRIRSAG